MNFRKLTLVIIMGFLLGIHNGYIALWKDGNEDPVEVFPFRAEMLPRVDHEKLSHGIRIDSANELAQLMEDYLS